MLGEVPADVADAVADALRRDQSLAADTSLGRAFLQVFNPPLRLIVIGAVHIAQALVPMASLAGYQVTVVDPRRAFATDSRFPDVAMTQDWPDEAMQALAPDRRTAVVALTHDPKLDDPGARRGAAQRGVLHRAPSAAGAPMPAGSSGWPGSATTRRPSPGSTVRPASTSGR